MGEHKAKILLLVEGAKTDVEVMNHLLKIYGIGDRHEIVSYNTNIYNLYKALFKDDDPEVIDILQLLKSKEKDVEKKRIFDERFSDILLVFDLDPQDAEYSPNIIEKLLEYFNESSENGKLYLNYPMVEAFYHMRSIPDPDYYEYKATIAELKAKSYKTRVHRESRNRKFEMFAADKPECDQVIIQNIKKSNMIIHRKGTDSTEPASSGEIFRVQAECIKKEARLNVLCTCVFYIYDYNSNLIVE